MTRLPGNIVFDCLRNEKWEAVHMPSTLDGVKRPDTSVLRLLETEIDHVDPSNRGGVSYQNLVVVYTRDFPGIPRKVSA